MVEQYKTSSPYKNTPQFNIQFEYLGFYNNRPVPADDTDKIIRLSADYHNRPDLLSHELYGTPDLWWTFAVRNPDLIEDPIYDLVTGMEIFVPTRSRMFNQILGL